MLYAEAKMGGLLMKIKKNKIGYDKKYAGKTDITSMTELQKAGIGKKERSRAELLNDNRDAIQEVIDEETAKGNIPTIEKVLRKIRDKKAERDRESLKRKAKTYSKMKKY